MQRFNFGVLWHHLMISESNGAFVKHIWLLRLPLIGSLHLFISSGLQNLQRDYEKQKNGIWYLLPDFWQSLLSALQLINNMSELMLNIQLLPLSLRFLSLCTDSLASSQLEWYFFLMANTDSTYWIGLKPASGVLTSADDAGHTRQVTNTHPQPNEKQQPTISLVCLCPNVLAPCLQSVCICSMCITWLNG